MVKCPVCGKRFETAESPAMPFCSERCRTIDLGRWLNEKNRLSRLRAVDPDAAEAAEYLPTDPDGEPD
jgi:endogenous inhibitor of DNA gyrase (YacG/DUF329 family)